MTSSYFLFRLGVVSGLVLTQLGCLKTRSEKSEQEEKRQVMNQMNSLQKERADSDSRFEDLASALRVLNGKIETLEHKVEVADETHAKKEKEQQTTKTDILDQMKVFEEEMEKLKTELSQMKTDLALIQAGKTSREDKEPKIAISEKGIWEEAEALFSQKEFKKAIAAYQKYREKYSKGKSIGEATFKIGVCFQELGMKSEAQAFYTEVLEKYPKDLSAKKAKYRLNQMKK